MFAPSPTRPLVSSPQANWGRNTVARFAPYPTPQRLWTYDMGGTTGGVATDGSYVYAMLSTGPTVTVLNKTSGAFVRRFDLTGASDRFANLYVRWWSWFAWLRVECI